MFSAASVERSVSVLVTSHNLEHLIRQTLDSVRAQTFQDLELLIVDDASSDSTADRIQAWLDDTRFPARFTRNVQRRGLCASLNGMLAIAQGQYVCMLDHDDVYAADSIARQWALLQQQPPVVAAVYGDGQIIDGDGQLLHASFLGYHLGDEPPPHSVNLFSRLLLRGNFLPASGVMVRRHALDAVGRYDESLFYQDYDMWLKLSHRFRFERIDGMVMQYRLLPDSASRSARYARAMLESESRILRSWLGRCGPLQDALVDRMWKLGGRQLDRAFYDDAKETFAAVAAFDPAAYRRAAVALFDVPGAATTVSAVRRGFQFANRGAAAVARRARRLAQS